MLRFENLTLHRGSKHLFSDASFTLHLGQSVGITGANGTGKSTLLALILNQLQPDAGDFNRPADWIIAHVSQETPVDLRQAIDYVLDGDRELRRIEHALLQAEQADEGALVAELHAQLEAIGGYGARAKAARLLQGLGFKTGEEALPVRQFSGGWRMRLNLAQALFCRSDLLLLDEPTNHLDLDAVIWLEGWLKQYQGTLLLISHDRDFLDAVCKQILNIEHQRVKLYNGNYSAFEQMRAQRLTNQQSAYLHQKREIARLQHYVERFRAKANKARQAQSRLKALQRMELIAPAHVDSLFHFSFKNPEKLPNPLLSLEKAATGYGHRRVLDGVDLTLSPGDRMGLIGVNGAGKSTFIKLLAGELEPQAGVRKCAQYLKIGYFAQHQLDQLEPDQTPLEHLLLISPASREQSLRNYLGSFGFTGDSVDNQIAPFSGGEKARLVLAMLILQRPNLLLLDEPTNHLDLEMRHALTLALQDFQGATLIISHDRHLLRTTCDRLLLIDNGGVNLFDGDLDDYSGWIKERNNQAGQSPAAVDTQPSHSADARKARKRQEAEKRRRLQPLQSKLRRLEEELEQLTTKQSRFESQLATPELYDITNSDRLKTLLVDKATIDRALSATEEAWIETSETLERLKQQDHN